MYAYRQNNATYFTLIMVLLGVAVGLLSCENDLREVRRITEAPEEEAVDVSHDVTILYSDSTFVKAELTSPELRIYHDTTGNYEFQKGVQIIMFDENEQEKQRIVSDYAIQHQKAGITEFRDNVVLTMIDGSVIKTEELFYDEKKQIYYNTVPIAMFFKDGKGDLYAPSFESDMDFNDIRSEGNVTGYYLPTDDSQFPSFGN